MQTWGAILAGVYVAGLTLTAHHLYSVGRKTWDRRILQFTAAIGWPLYALVFQRKILANVLARAWQFVVVMFPAWYIGFHWDTCEDWGECSVVVGKSLLWAPFWPAYVFLVQA